MNDTKNDNLNIVLTVFVGLLEFIGWAFNETATWIRKSDEDGGVRSSISAVLITVPSLVVIFGIVATLAHFAPRPEPQPAATTQPPALASPLPSPKYLAAITQKGCVQKGCVNQSSLKLGPPSLEYLAAAVADIQQQLANDERELKAAKAKPDEAERDVTEIQAEIAEWRAYLKKTQAQLKKKKEKK